MIIEGNGISIDAEVEGRTLCYRVTRQTKEATGIINAIAPVLDEESPFTLKSNKHPSFNKKLNRFFVRGYNKEEDEKVVSINFKSTALATQALAALERLVKNIVLPDGVSPCHSDSMKPVPGGTTHIRFAFLNRSMAEKIQLTGKKYYPDEVVWDVGTKPIKTINRHYNEHIAQGVDVLNKAFGNAKTKGVINPHNVTHDQALSAVNALREMFNHAHENDYLIAFWRMVTALRGPDFVDPEDKAEHPR